MVCSDYVVVDNVVYMDTSQCTSYIVSLGVVIKLIHIIIILLFKICIMIVIYIISLNGKGHGCAG